jgi:colanic acid biosynthesis protein WcaH
MTDSRRLDQPTPLDQLTRRIDAAVEDARQGLPEPVFLLVSRLTPMVNVDLLIRDEAGRLLLTWRADHYYGAGWHIPGGIIRFKETWERRIAEVARLELGAAVQFDPEPRTIRQAFAPHRDDRGHFISLLFDCTLTGPLPADRQARGDPPANGEWAWHEGFPDNLLAVQRRIYGDLIG